MVVIVRESLQNPPKKIAQKIAQKIGLLINPTSFVPHRKNQKSHKPAGVEWNKTTQDWTLEEINFTVLESCYLSFSFGIYIIWWVHIDFLLWKWRDFVFTIQTLGDSIILVCHPWYLWPRCQPVCWLVIRFVIYLRKPRWTGVSTGRSYVPNYRKWHQTESPYKKIEEDNCYKHLQTRWSCCNEWMRIHKKDLSGSESLGHWPACWEAERMDRW